MEWLTDWLMDLFGGQSFWNQVGSIADAVNNALYDAKNYLNSVNFTQVSALQYIGYFKYIVGTPLYVAITSAFVIVLGYNLWNRLLSGIDRVKSLLPW